MIPLAVVLSKQPFLSKPRAPGVNSAKIRPLELAIAGVVHWAAESPTVMRNPKICECTSFQHYPWHTLSMARAPNLYTHKCVCVCVCVSCVVCGYVHGRPVRQRDVVEA